MRSAWILMPAAFLTACGSVWSSDGLRSPRADYEPCLSPVEILRAYGEDAMAAVLVRMGDELLVCGRRYEATWQALEATRTTLD